MPIPKTLEFTKVRTTKKDWQDAACQECNDDLWVEGKVKYAYIWCGAMGGAYIQLCSKCFDKN